MTQWVDIIGYESLYEINSDGDIKRNGRILKQNSATGYPSVTLCKGNKKSMHSIHRLISVHFIPNPENKPFINHIDGNKANYKIENLEWVTQSENCLHAYRTGLAAVSENCKRAVSLKHSGASHYNSKKVVHAGTGKVFDTIRAASKFVNAPVQSVHRHLHNNSNKYDLSFI